MVDTVDNNPNSTADDGQPGAPDDGMTRTKSTVKFAYFSVSDAVRVATVLMNQRGGSCEVTELAADLKQVATSGSFRLRISAARMYGFIETEKKNVSITPLGRRAISPQTAAAAMVDGFLNVELNSLIYDEYKSGTLPETQGLESRMQALGVTQNQVHKARQVFTKSAQQAGFFGAGRNRLVKPALGASTPEEKHDQDKPPPGTKTKQGSTLNTSKDGGGDLVADPILVGLLKRMLPKEGEEFPAARRRLLVSALVVNLEVIYGPANDGHIDAEELAKLFKSETSGTPKSTHAVSPVPEAVTVNE